MLLGTVSAKAEQKGSITLRLAQTAAGIEVTLYQIAGYENDGFVYKDSFAGSGINVSGLKTASEYERQPKVWQLLPNPRSLQVLWRRLVQMALFLIRM